jgi:hypothetical protein
MGILICCGEPRGGLLLGRAESRIDYNVNRLGCENLEISEESVDFAGH